MVVVDLLLGAKVFQFPDLPIRQVCMKFQTNPLPPHYRVLSVVSSEVFEQFLSALNGKMIEVTKTNFKELSALCDEFGFELNSPSYRLAQVETTIEELKGDIERISSQLASLDGIPSVLTQLSGSMAKLEGDISVLKEWNSAPDSHIFSDLHSQGTDSGIVSDFPHIFAEFRGKQVLLLWRGSRDGFKKEEFHRRCDGHANTLTVILDTNGNIFGGFTPVEWESGYQWKGDDSQKSFVFTLKNPHNIPARRFGLKAEMKNFAIRCFSERGPYFGSGADFAVLDDCNANTNSGTYFGRSYTNDTGLEGKIVFTGSNHFQVKEIEVFEITD
jgi:hypothetical protein